jgi:WD40 repeat protein
LISTYQNFGIPFASQKYQVIWDKLFEGILFRLKFDEPFFWVLDGLDEAESPGVLCDLMTKINSAASIRILLVSRPTKDLLSALSANGYLHREEIQTRDTAEDIQAHVSEAVSRIIPDNINEQRTKVIDSILSKANGSFLWVKLALERVKDNWYTPDDIQTALDGIPEGMDTMYTRMIEDVAAQSGRNRTLAVDILTWASCAFRPLDVEELAVALNNDFAFENIQSLAAAIADVCGNFVVVKKSQVSLIHETARTFLLAERSRLIISIDRGKSHERIAIVCMKFLSNFPKWREAFSVAQDTNSNSTSDQQSTSHAALNDPFLWYATTYWAYHVSCASAEMGKCEILQNAVFEFLDKYALLWINAVALEGDLRILTRSAAYFKAWAKRKARHASEVAPTSLSLSHASNGVEELLGWANDLIRVVGRFGAYLAVNPSSIHKHVVPFCPHDSMLYTTYQYQNGNAISVKGISSGKWDDCLARLTMGGDERATKIVAKDNYFIALIGSSGTLVIWHAETCEEARRICHDEYVTGIKASKTSNLVATAGIKTIRVWDIVRGEEIYNIPKTNQGRIMSLAFTSNDTELLIAFDDCTVQCVDLKSTIEQWYFRAEDPSEPEHSCPRLMSFSQDAKKIAIAYRGRPVFVWRITRQRGQRPMRCIRRDDILKKAGDVWNAPEVVLWQPDSPNILILYQDTNLVDWNLDNNSQTEHAHLKAREMAVSSDGNLLLTSDNNGLLSVWTTGHFRLVYELAYAEFVRDIAFSPDAQRLYDVRGTLCNVWEPDALVRSDDSNREDISTHDSTLWSVPVVSSDNNDRVQISALIGDDNDQYYCTGKDDGTVTIFEMDTAKQHRKLYTHSSSVSVIEMAWSSKQKYFASVDNSGRLIAKRLEKPANRPAKWKVFPLFDFRLGIAVTQLLFSSSEEFLLVSADSVDRVYSTKTKEKLFQVSRPDETPRRWVQHPTNPRFLIGIEGEEHALYQWSNMEKVDRDLFDRANDIECLSIKDPLGNPLVRTPSRSAETLTTPENVSLLQDRYLILEFISNRNFSARTSLAASRRIDMVDLQDAKLQRTSLPSLGRVVNRLIGVTQEHLVFLDHQYWVCTWDIEGGDNGEYTKHFFLPKDWLSPGARRLITLNRYGTLLCPKNGEVAIVREGIRI